MADTTKALVRWTVGPADSKFDDAILRRSILNFRKIYGDRFDCVVCFNGRESSSLDSLGIHTLRQEPLKDSPEPEGVAWKLYPPRLRPEAHEIFIDHDIVFVERLSKIDRFLSTDDAFIYSQAFSENGLYGRFRSSVTHGFRLNSGFFGLPPGFSFSMEGMPPWGDRHDEQGFVASMLCRRRNLIRVDLDELWICADERMPTTARGYHFCGTNRDRSWPRFVGRTAI